jgi:hypothetical protein
MLSALDQRQVLKVIDRHLQEENIGTIDTRLLSLCKRGERKIGGTRSLPRHLLAVDSESDQGKQEYGHDENPLKVQRYGFHGTMKIQWIPRQSLALHPGGFSAVSV